MSAEPSGRDRVDPAPPGATVPPRAPSAFLQALGTRSLIVTVVLAVLAAVVLRPVFMVPFSVVLLRTLFLAVLMLLVHAAARQWVPRWLPGWLPGWAWPVVPVALTALPATLLVYLVTLKGDVAALLVPERVWGILFIAGFGLGLGLLAAIAAGVRQRLAEARSQALQFALERSRLEKQAVDARLALLQAQIEPHFLFNTLANVQVLVEAGSPRAAPVLKSLIAYLRAALPRLHDGPATLAQELDLVRAYLELMQMRMPDRLQFDIRPEPARLQRPFPPMAVLTLVENAVRHGIDPLEQGGRISVAVGAEDGRWWVSVSDDGRGIDPRSQPGTGLSNLRERLQGFFGPGAALVLEERSPQGLCARIVVPDTA